MSQSTKLGDRPCPNIDNKMEFIQGARMEAKDFTNKWYPIKIVQVDWGDREVLVHFEQWSSRYDEWIKIDSDRLRPSTKPVKTRSKKREFRIGDKVLAPWSDNRKYPAQLVTKYADGTCQIVFFDGFSKRIKQNSLCELSSNQANKINYEGSIKSKASTTQGNVELPSSSVSKNESSAVGSKEERRARKRKLVVSELFSHHKRLKKDEETLSPLHFNDAIITERKADTFEQHDHKCLVEDCTKEFRNEKLLMMHIKHYHPDYTNNEFKSVSVMEMAHQRVGEGEADEVKNKSLPSKIVSQSDPKYTKKILLEHKTTLGYERSKHKKKSKFHAKKVAEKDLLPNMSASSNFGEESGDPSEMSLCETNPILTFELDNSTDQINDSKEAANAKYLKDNVPADSIQLKKRESESEDFENHCYLQKRKRLSSSKSSLKNDERLVLESSLCDLDDNVSLAPSVQEESEETEDSVIETEYDLINCQCGDNEEEGLMIQCEWCYTWQHGACHNINVETDVPEKYVCKTCLNPKNERPSRRYCHDQDWLKQGTLHQFNFIGSQSDDNFNSLMKKTNDLILLVLSLKSVARCLRHKLNISGNVKHPKLVQWAKPWLSKENFFDSEFENSLMSECTPLTENTQLNVGLIETFQGTNTKLEMSPDSPQILQRPIPTVTVADDNTNLLNSVSNTCLLSGVERSHLAEKTNEINFEPIEGCDQVSRAQYTNPYSNLHDRIKQWSSFNTCCHESNKYLTEHSNQNLQYVTAGCEAKVPDEKKACDFLDEKECIIQNLPSNLPPICMPSTNSLNQSDSYIQYSGPIPETPIDMKECQLNLLDHIEDVENLLDKTLESLEVQLTALENNIEWCTSLQHVGKCTELMQLLSRDLETIKQMAAC